MEAATLRPLALGEILDVAIKIYLRNFRTLFLLVLLVMAPVGVLTALVQLSLLPDDFNRPEFSPPPPTDTTPFEVDELWATVAGSLLLVVATVVGSALATGACFKAIGSAYLGEKATWRPSLAFAARRVHSILWVTFLSGLAAVLGLLLCIVPGVWLWVAFAVAVPVFLTEGLKGSKSLGRSRRLVKGRWWPTFGLLLLGYLLAGFVSAAFTALVLAAAVADVGEVVYVALNAVASTIGTVVSTPFTAAFVTVLYFDLRVRKEGFDLALLADRIGVEPDPSRSPLPRPLAGPPARHPAPGYSRPSAAEQGPPYWPPPPGWRPSSAPEADAPPPPGYPQGTGSPPAPPYWPPPPGQQPSPASPPSGEPPGPEQGRD